GDQNMEVENRDVEMTDELSPRDVDGSVGVSTPPQKRLAVDSRTITRPKRTSPPAVSLPHVFNQENVEVAVAPQSVSSISPRSSTMSSAAPTPAATMTAPAAAATPAAQTVAPTAAPAPGPPEGVVRTSAAPPRAARQQTVVVHSASANQMRAIVEQAKNNGLPDAGVAQLEKSLMDFISIKDREWSAKYEKMGAIMLERKQEADREFAQMKADKEGLEACVNCLLKAAETTNQDRAFIPSVPNLPPAPVLAAMSADKLAEMTRLKKENEALINENTKLHDQHASSFGVYKMQKEAIGKFHSANAELEEKVRTLRDGYDRLKRHAESKLDEASIENDQLRRDLVRKEKSHDQDTIGIRMRLKKAESEVAELQENLEQKRKQNSELKDICEELIRKADMSTSDVE
ncbi:hypothetical protein PFISCL1PPCAC_26757, partial [Pristionchus fissidentatus]